MLDLIIPGSGILSPAIAALLALSPAALALWMRRTVIGSADDPAGAERWWAFQLRMRQVATLSGIILSLAASWRTQAWALALCWLATTASTHEIRRALFGETWSFPRRLWWQVRFNLALRGFWLLMLLAPAIVSSTGWPRVTAAGLGIGLLAWSWCFAPIFAWLTGARPLMREPLCGPFDAVLSRASIPRPHLLEAAPRGGFVVNALALPGAVPTVLFFEGLLTRLTPDEAAVIFAHEIAHLEFFASPAGRRLLWWSRLAIVGAVGGVPAAMAVGLPPLVGVVIALASVLAGLLMLANGARQRETDSDLRAIDLGGNPEALVRGLTKIHAATRVPRRWDARLEQNLSHPSLASRMRDIRRHAAGSDTVAEALAGAVAAAGAEPRRFVVLEPERLVLVWTSGEPASVDADAILAAAERTDARRYDELIELRVDASTRTPKLTLADTKWRRVSMALRPDDVARVQTALDFVDRRLATAPPAPAVPHEPLARVAALLIACAGIQATAGVLALAAPILLVMLRPTPPTMAALAAATATLALQGRFGYANVSWPVLMLGAGALALAWLTRLARSRGETTPSSESRGPRNIASLAAVLLALLTAAAWQRALSIDPRGLIDVYAALSADPTPAISLAALAACLALMPTLRVRRAGYAAAGLLMATFVAGSERFADHVAGDPLVTTTPALDEHSSAAVAIADVKLPSDRFDLVLSPSARHFLILRRGTPEDLSPDEATATVLVGDFSGWTREVTAREAAFLDDERLVFLVPGPHQEATLVIERVQDGARTVLPIGMPMLAWTAFRVRADGGWTALGLLDDGWLMRVDGHLDGRRPSRRRAYVSLAGDADQYVRHLVDGSGTSLALGMFYAQPALSRMLNRPGSMLTSLVGVTGEQSVTLARSRLSSSCVARSTRGYYCLAFDGERSRVWSVEAADGRLASKGAVPGYVYGLSSHAEGLIAGLRNDRPILLRPETGDLVSFTGVADSTSEWRELAYVPGRLAVLDRPDEGSTSVLRLYAVDLPAASSVRARAAR